MAMVWSMPSHYSDNGTELDWGVRRKIQDRVGRGFGTECNGIRIRINPKRESAAASKGRKQRNDMAALAAKVRDIRDRTKHLAGLMENFEKDLRATIDVANKVGVIVPDPSGQLASARRAVEELQDTWTAIIKQNREGVV